MCSKDDFKMINEGPILLSTTKVVMEDIMGEFSNELKSLKMEGIVR